MNQAFADAQYWIARINPRDQWHNRAQQVSLKLVGVHLVTTEEIITEVLNHFSGFGHLTRGKAVQVVDAVHANPSVTVIPQSHQSFQRGYQFYRSRPDKSYSLTDCISMEAMRLEGITEVLTGDHHFAQEGFTLLL
jgi:predicted nucleic acid-binding protein